MKNKKTILAFIALLNLFSFQLCVPFSLTAQNNRVDFSSALTVVNSLDSTQRAKAVFPVKDMSRYDWNYLPPQFNSKKRCLFKRSG